jgi:hypothetical protein
MIFEMTGFLVGVVAIGVPLLLLYRREANRAMTAISGTGGRRRI